MQNIEKKCNGNIIEKNNPIFSKSGWTPEFTPVTIELNEIPSRVTNSKM